MGFLNLCRGDALVETLHDYFGANVLAVPEERVQPLTIVARRKGKQVFRGAFENLIASGQLDGIPVQPSRMAELSGKQSRTVDVDLGLRILGGFLSGFGIPSAGIGTHLKRARGLSFRFADVCRRWVDPGIVGHRLETVSLNPGSPAAGLYFGENPWQLLLVDSVITSNRFTVSASGSTGEGASIDVPALQQLVGQVNTKIAVESSVESEVSFAGEQPLTFAFTLQRIFLDSTGRISTINPEDLLLGEPGKEIAAEPTRVRLSDEPALVGWDTIEAHV